MRAVTWQGLALARGQAVGGDSRERWRRQPEVAAAAAA